MSDAAAAPIRNVTTGTDAFENFREPSGIWNWMRIIVIVATIDYFIIAGASALTWAIYARLAHISVEDARISDAIILWSSRAVIPLLVGSAFVTLRVAYRITRNLEIRNPGANIPSAGWVCFSFFVPFVNFAAPPLLLGEVWRETFSNRSNPRDGSGVIGWWWASWLISALLMIVSTYLIKAGAPNATVLTGDIRSARELLWAILTLAYGLRGVCALLLLGVFGALVRGQRANVDVAAFD